MLEALFEKIARTIGYVLLEIVWASIVYPTGFAILKVCSLGSRPAKYSGPERSVRSNAAYSIGTLFWICTIVIGVLMYFEQFT